MNKRKIIKQLESLLDNARSLVVFSDKCSVDIFVDDVTALSYALYVMYQELEKEDKDKKKSQV